jgi:cell fate regulator YaaT (PSP1 superfamily)
MKKIYYINDCERGCRKQQNEQKEWDVSMCPGCCKLSGYNWLNHLPSGYPAQDIFEIRFKNTHKGFYQNVNKLSLSVGDIVAVESTSGHDIGIINMGGPLVRRQLIRQNIKPSTYDLKKIYRKAKPFDIEKWQDAIAREHPTMIKSRQLAASLKLEMKIGDVEFQGDGSKAIFYYIADERVDFRELIKLLATEFHIRIEMRQIGARQEAGLIGGLGVCGRELCCSQWMSGFSTVNANAARWQELALNPLKLTGQCGKLKCCLNHEVALYIDAQKEFPKVTVPLETADGQLFLQKTDVLKGIMYFTPDAAGNGEQITIPVARVKEFIALNKQGTKIPAVTKSEIKPEQPAAFKGAVGEDSITRFDKKKKSRHKHNRQRRNKQAGKTASNHHENANKK